MSTINTYKYIPPFADTFINNGQQREIIREIMQKSGLSSMLQTLARDQLHDQAIFEEYNDTIILLRWGTIYTRRHLWIEIVQQTQSIRFRYLPHMICGNSQEQCDGEYHTYSPDIWKDKQALWDGLLRYYRKAIPEDSSD